MTEKNLKSATKIKTFIFEGPDGCGKTTAIQTLIEMFGPGNSIRTHNGLYKSPTAAFESFRSQLHDAGNRDKFTLIDRLHLSEIFYGNILRNKTMSDEQFIELESIIKEINVITILCLPKYETAHYNWSSRLDEEHVKKEKSYKEIYEMYKKSKSYSSSKIHYFDYEKDDIVELYLKLTVGLF